MKNIIKFIINQEHESTDTYLNMVEPISEKFNIDLEIAEDIIKSVVEWETNDDIHNSLEEFLVIKLELIMENKIRNLCEKSSKDLNLDISFIIDNEYIDFRNGNNYRITLNGEKTKIIINEESFKDVTENKINELIVLIKESLWN